MDPRCHPDARRADPRSRGSLRPDRRRGACRRPCGPLRLSGWPEVQSPDLIIWQEIVKHARDKAIKSVIICTNDNKQDWVYAPPAIVDERGRQSNEDRTNFKVILPLPLLQHEVRVHNPDAKLNILNLGMLATMLHQEMGRPCPNLFAAYQPIGQVVVAPEPIVPPVEPEVVQPIEVVPIEPQRRAATTDIIRDIRAGGADVASTAVRTARDALMAGVSTDELKSLARALVESVPRGLEAAALLVRDIVSRQCSISSEARATLIEGMFRALYFEESGRIRDKPLEGVLNDLFSVQGEPELKSIVDALDAALAGHKQRYLLTPDSGVPLASLTITGDPDDAGAMLVASVLSGEYQLILDVGSDSARSLLKIFGGARTATVDDFRSTLARYFRVPVLQLDLNLVRSQRLAWDDLTGFVEWGARSDMILR